VDTAFTGNLGARIAARSIAALAVATLACLGVTPATAKPGKGKSKAVAAKQAAKPKPKPVKAKKAKKASKAKAKRVKAKARGAKKPARKAAPTARATARVTHARPRAQAQRSGAPPRARAAGRSASATPRGRARARARRARRASRAVAPVAAASAGAAAESRAADRRAAERRAAERRAAARRAASRRARTPKPAAEPKLTAPVRAATRVIERVPGWFWVLLAAVGGLAVIGAAGSLFAGLRARRAERRRQEVMADVGLLQAALLPPVPAAVGALRLSTAYRPAQGPAAGGDFYDAFPLREGRVGLAIGDVSGHGQGALAQTALVRFTLRAYVEAGLEPRDALKLSQSVLEDKLGEEFVTVLLATYDPRSSRLTYAAAGHPPPLLRGGPPVAAVTAASAPLIGAGIGTGVRQTTVSLSDDTIVCLYTDGLVETMVGDRMLGQSELAGVLDSLGPEPTAQRLLDHVVEQADRVNDDIAVCLAQATTAGRVAPYLVEELEVVPRDLGQGIPERFLLACGVPAKDVREGVRSAEAVCEDFGSALLRVQRHERPPRLEVRAASIEGIITPS
jgi:Stage II sporulation protein E (SpoIIE)